MYVVSYGFTFLSLTPLISWLVILKVCLLLFSSFSIPFSFKFQTNSVIDLTDSPVKGINAVKASPVVIEDSPVKKKVKQLDTDYQFLDGDPQKPVLFLGKSLSTSRIVSILFRPGPGMLCTKQPLKVKKECSFLVDLRRISLEDLRADGNPPYDRYEFFLWIQ